MGNGSQGRKWQIGASAVRVSWQLRPVTVKLGDGKRACGIFKIRHFAVTRRWAWASNQLGQKLAGFGLDTLCTPVRTIMEE